MSEHERDFSRLNARRLPQGRRLRRLQFKRAEARRRRINSRSAQCVSARPIRRVFYAKAKSSAHRAANKIELASRRSVALFFAPRSTAPEPHRRMHPLIA